MQLMNNMADTLSSYIFCPEILKKWHFISWSWIWYLITPTPPKITAVERLENSNMLLKNHSKKAFCWQTWLVSREIILTSSHGKKKSCSPFTVFKKWKVSYLWRWCGWGFRLTALWWARCFLCSSLPVGYEAQLGSLTQGFFHCFFFLSAASTWPLDPGSASGRSAISRVIHIPIMSTHTSLYDVFSLLFPSVKVKKTRLMIPLETSATVKGVENVCFIIFLSSDLRFFASHLSGFFFFTVHELTTLPSMIQTPLWFD